MSQRTSEVRGRSAAEGIVGRAAGFSAETLMLEGVLVGHVRSSSGLEHRGVAVSAKGFELVELVGSIGVGT